MGKFTERIKTLIKRYKLQYAQHVALFFVILFGFHFLYGALINEDLVIPGLEGMYTFLREYLFVHSAWVVEHVLGYEITRQATPWCLPTTGASSWMKAARLSSGSRTSWC